MKSFSGHNISRLLASVVVFSVMLMLMIFFCTWGWDAFVNGKVYYCTDGGTLDFWFVGDWVHHPESVAHVVPRSMSEPDEIKAGWSLAGLWILWAGFIAVSVCISGVAARIIWLTGIDVRNDKSSPLKSSQVDSIPR
jgi:hypothetical protein